MTLLSARTRTTPTAKIDPVTGLGNGAMFVHEIEREVARYQRNGDPFSILILAAAEKYSGDPSRDSVIAKMLHDLARAEDAACHLKGRWFGVVLAGAREAGARAALERVRGATDWQPGQPLTEPLTGGVAEWMGDMSAPQELIERAYADLERYDAAFTRDTMRWLPNQA